jgi:hypothetical protein
LSVAHRRIAASRCKFVQFSPIGGARLGCRPAQAASDLDQQLVRRLDRIGRNDQAVIAQYDYRGQR